MAADGYVLLGMAKRVNRGGPVMVLLVNGDDAELVEDRLPSGALVNPDLAMVLTMMVKIVVGDKVPPPWGPVVGIARRGRLVGLTLDGLTPDGELAAYGLAAQLHLDHIEPAAGVI